jgi:hypothetical protein
VPGGGHPNGVKHARKKGSNEGVQAPLSKGIEKRKEILAGRIHPTDRIPPEIRYPRPQQKPVKQVMLYQNGGKNQAGEKTAGQQKGEAHLLG